MSTIGTKARIAQLEARVAALEARLNTLQTDAATVHTKPRYLRKPILPLTDAEIKTMPEWMTTTVAAEYLKTSPTTIRNWIDAKKLDAPMVDGCYRIPYTEVLRLHAERERRTIHSEDTAIG